MTESSYGQLIAEHRAVVWSLRPHRSEKWGGYWALPGWASLIRRLHDDLLQIAPGYEVDEVTRASGGLSFRLAFGPDVHLFRDVIIERKEQAEAESFTICELCGGPGELRGSPSVRTRCHGHETLRDDGLYGLDGLLGR